MPTTHDREVLRFVLNRDRAWAVYPLGDLDDRHFPLCDWYVSEDRTAFLLLYRGSKVPVVVGGGDVSLLTRLLEESGPPPELDLHVQPNLIPVLSRYYQRISTRPLVRMLLGQPSLVDAGQAVLLSAADVPALEALYADGEASGESPDFFFPSMLDDRSFYGIWEQGALVSAAGTHLVSRGESVAAIGNVYTRRDRRGQGLGAQTTSAVVVDLLNRGIQTVALSVVAANRAAIRVYERLGFVEHCRFVDGMAADLRHQGTASAVIF